MLCELPPASANETGIIFGADLRMSGLISRLKSRPILYQDDMARPGDIRARSRYPIASPESLLSWTSRPYFPGGTAGKSKSGYKITLPSGTLPLPLLWAPLPGAATPAASIHKTYLRAVWRSRTWLGAVLLLMRFGLWPFTMAAAAFRQVRRNAAAARAASGKGALRQYFELVWLCACHGFRPSNYYTFELYRSDRFRQAADYIHRFEMKEGVYRLLKVDTTSPLQSKEGFSRYCQAKDLPTTPIIASFAQGQWIDRPAADGLPQRDLFLKRTSGRGGARAELLVFENGRYHSKRGGVYDADELIAHAILLSRTEAYILQPREVNHEAIADLSPSALATVRIVTVLNEMGRGETVRAVFRMGQSHDSVVDNFHAGGIAAPVNIETGELGVATDFGLSPSVGWLDRHPATGAQIAGRQLPQWAQIKTLAERAHASFQDRIVVGWDIALTQGGLILVEGNAAADVDNIQRPHRSPLGRSRYAELVAWHLDRLHGARP